MPLYTIAVQWPEWAYKTCHEDVHSMHERYLYEQRSTSMIEYARQITWTALANRSRALCLSISGLSECSQTSPALNISAAHSCGSIDRSLMSWPFLRAAFQNFVATGRRTSEYMRRACRTVARVAPGWARSAERICASCAHVRKRSEKFGRTRYLDGLYRACALKGCHRMSLV